MSYPIFLLHCPGFTAYRDGAEARITQYFGRRINVVTGSVPGHPLYEEEIKGITVTNVEPGAIGCAIGSRVMMKRFLETDAPYALIFEDDVELDEDYLPSDYDSALSRISVRDPEWDWMLLFRPWQTDWNVVTPEPGYETGRFRKCSRLSFTTHGYAVSRKGAQRLLDLSKNLDRPWDVFTFNGGLGRAYHGPELCYIHVDDSIIAAVNEKALKPEGSEL